MQKIIVSDHQNNYVRCLSIDDNITKNFNILSTGIFYVIILMMQTKLFSDLYLAKFLDNSAKLFFSST